MQTSLITCVLTAAILSGSAAAATPRLDGIWQSLDNDTNVEPHAAYASPRTDANAFDAAQPGLGLVVGGQIPYRPEARAKQLTNFADRVNLDPAAKCYMPGVPRANYMGRPLHIVQTEDHIFIAYEFAQASRTVYLNRPDFEAPVDSWMGHSIGRWEGDTLIIDVSAQVENTWLDRAGNHHSGALRVEERFKLEGPHHIRYQATLSDPAVYTKPWTIETMLYKQLKPNAQILDFRCVEFVEEWMYGELSKPEAE
jgi:hypothetical protein